MFKKICLLIFIIILLPSLSFGKVKTIYASHKYIMGDNDSKNDARKMCFIEAKRKVLEMAGTYIKSHTQIKNFRLTRDEINIYSAALLQVETTKEEWKFIGKNMAVFMTVKAVVDSRSVDEQLSKIEKDISLQKNIKEQQRKLKELEETVRLLQRQINETSLKKPLKKPIISYEKTLENSQKTLTLRKKKTEILKEIDDVEKRYKFIKAEINLRRGRESERKKEEERKSRVLGQNILKYIEIGMTPKEVEYILGKPDKKINPWTDSESKKYNMSFKVIHLKYGHYNIVFTDIFTDNLTVASILFQFPEKSKELQFVKHDGDTNCLNVHLKKKFQKWILDIQKGGGIRHIGYQKIWIPYPPECLSYFKRYFGDVKK